MALTEQLVNAQVASYTSGGSPKLAATSASISKPTNKDSWPMGGILRYVVQLDPTADIAPGDFLQITQYGAFVLDPLKRYIVFSAAMDGVPPDEVWHCLIGDKVQR